MAHPSTIAPHVAGASFGQIIVDTFTDFKARRAQRAAYRQVFNELSAMSDRDLSDIGLGRSMIRDVARRAADAA